ncbi:MAG TPA: o-succinylbenzoate--CoA ligase [Pseudonocardiaceae bacterium]|nr:o-succinylbenzoate--CoA ligase [Pseudonocardiaceae bacterium]
MRVLTLDGRPESARTLLAALADTLAGGPALLPLSASDPRLAESRAAMAPTEPLEPDTAVVIRTSGSAGEAKGVLLSANALHASAAATHERLGGPGRWLLATPAQFVGGLQVLVRSLLAGTRPGVVDLSVPFRGGPFADAAAEVLAGSGPRYTALVPTQLVTLLDEGGRGLAALRAFDTVIIGAAATPPELARRAADAGVRAVPAYGMSETASGCVYDGLPLAGLRVRLADADGQGVGRIELAGPMLAHGYRRAPEPTAAAFVDGWFRTGDEGRMVDGRLDVLGRTDDLINTGGVKVSPSVVERVLAAQPGVLAVCVVGVPDARWGQAVVAAVVPVDPANPPGTEALAAVVRERVGRAAVPKRFGFTERLPVRGPGKVDRSGVRAMLDGTRVTGEPTRG